MHHGSMPGLEALMDAAWPAAERQEEAGWVLRAASGVTQRANSVWPRSEPGNASHDRRAALRSARQWYRNRRLPLIFQVSADQRHQGLNALLDEEGFTRQTETLILVRDAAPDQDPDQEQGAVPAWPGVEVSGQPSEEWLRLWWSVEGRGGAAELAVARGILAGCPSLYALARDEGGVPAAVGRLAVPPGRPARGGLDALAARPDVRRQGHATRITGALLRAGAGRGLGGYWLPVTAANSGARELYAKAGFLEAGRCLYRQDRPRRHLTGC